MCQLKACFSDEKGGNSLLIEAVKRDSTGIVLLILVCVCTSVSLRLRLLVGPCVPVYLFVSVSATRYVHLFLLVSLPLSVLEKPAATLIMTPLQQGKEEYGDEINRQNSSGDTALIVARSILSTPQPPYTSDVPDPKAWIVARCTSRL